MITFKSGVECVRIDPLVFVAIAKIHGCYLRHDYGDLVVTALRDGEHMVDSKHYEGLAFDCRIWSIPLRERKRFIDILADELGSDFDVVLHKTHIHIEYDPD